jgi:DNA-3-methyladenine glycosylase II
MNKDKIKQYLLDKDAKLSLVFSAVTYPVNRRSEKNVYSALLRSIISQQLSVKAAATIHARVLKLFPDNNDLPELLLRMPLDKLRSAGVSKQKATYLKAIAKVACDDGLDYDVLSKKSDAELIKYLTHIHGVGQWTVEMLLMFIFNRKDVFPLADVGVQNAMRRLYGMEEEGEKFKKKLLVISEQWKPYRTIVCKYLWGWKSSGYRGL